MKRLAAVTMMIAVVVFMAASASAQSWETISGTYEMLATGGCFHSTHLNSADVTESEIAALGVKIWNWNGTGAGNWWTSIYVGQGTFTFSDTPAPAADTQHAGYAMGTMAVAANCIHSNGYLIQTVTPPLNAGVETLPLYYKIEDGVEITVHIPAVGLWMSGRVSPDRKSMTLVSTAQMQNAKDFSTGSPVNIIQMCNISRVLFRVGR